MSATAPPLDPSADRARELLLRELSKQEYQASKPNLFDRLAQSFWNWVTSIHFGSVTGAPALAIAVLSLLIVATVVVLLLVFGVPRLNRRSTEPGALFGAHDERSSEQLRASARQAAATGDFDRAIAESYRAIARGMAERGLVTTAPGTTASVFGARASSVFPVFAERIHDAARSFDEVRYLDRPGTAAAWESIAALDADLERAQASGPLLADAAGRTA